MDLPHFALTLKKICLCRQPWVIGSELRNEAWAWSWLRFASVPRGPFSLFWLPAAMLPCQDKQMVITRLTRQVGSSLHQEVSRANVSSPSVALLGWSWMQWTQYIDASLFSEADKTSSFDTWPHLNILDALNCNTWIPSRVSSELVFGGSQNWRVPVLSKVNQKLSPEAITRGSGFSQGHTTLGRRRAKCPALNAEVTPFPLPFAHCYGPKDWHAAATKVWLVNVIYIYIAWVAKQLPGGWCHLGAESQFVDHSSQGLSAKMVVAESQLEEHVSLAWSPLLRADLAMAKTSRVYLGVAWWDDACKQMSVSCPERQGCLCISSLHTKWWDTETLVVRQFP